MGKKTAHAPLLTAATKMINAANDALHVREHHFDDYLKLIVDTIDLLMIERTQLNVSRYRYQANNFKCRQKKPLTKTIAGTMDFYALLIAFSLLSRVLGFELDTNVYYLVFVLTAMALCSVNLYLVVQDDRRQYHSRIKETTLSLAIVELSNAIELLFDEEQGNYLEENGSRDFSTRCNEPACDSGEKRSSPKAAVNFNSPVPSFNSC